MMIENETIFYMMYDPATKEYYYCKDKAQAARCRYSHNSNHNSNIDVTIYECKVIKEWTWKDEINDGY